MVDAAGLPLAFVLTPGQAADCPQFQAVQVGVVDGDQAGDRPIGQHRYPDGRRTYDPAVVLVGLAKASSAARVVAHQVPRPPRSSVTIADVAATLTGQTTPVSLSPVAEVSDSAINAVDPPQPRYQSLPLNGARSSEIDFLTRPGGRTLPVPRVEMSDGPVADSPAGRLSRAGRGT